MARSVIQNPFGIEWPLGFIAVANNGTPVNIMALVDPTNANAPGRNTGIPGTPAIAAEYTPTCHKIFIQAFKPGNNNNGMVPNTGYIYILKSLGPGNQNGGGPQNRADAGAMVAILPPGGVFTLPADEREGPMISPYHYTIDSDTDGDGALCVLVGCGRG